jgi:hypothetical protein
VIFQSRLAIAIELKNEGNIKYREQKFHDALEAYTSKNLRAFFFFKYLDLFQRRLKLVHPNQLKNFLNSIKIVLQLGNH